MTGLLFANALYLVIGIELLPLLRIARTRDELVSRLGLAYMLGVAVVGALSAHLALVRVPVGLVELVVLALVVGIAAWRRGKGLPTKPSDTLSLGLERLGIASRVLGVTAWAEDLPTARSAAYAAVEKIQFDGAHFRRDIGAGPCSDGR